MRRQDGISDAAIDSIRAMTREIERVRRRIGKTTCEIVVAELNAAMIRFMAP
jgi:hypothetical protein